MESEKIFDVIIIGAGPVGLCLGISLAQKNLDVLLLDKKASTAKHSRAPTIWPKTQEILSHLGIIKEFQSAAIKIPVMHIWDAHKEREILTIPLKELQTETRFPELLLLPQAETEKLLLNKLQQMPSATIHFSREVKKLIQEDQKATVIAKHNSQNFNFSGRVVVGADGAQSTVREQMKLDFPGTTYPFKAALADIEFSKPADLPFPRISTKNLPAIGIRLSDNLWRIIMPFSTKDHLEIQQRIATSVENLFGQRKWDLVWKSEFKVHRRLSSSFSKGRIVLAGDAAHLNSPVGGQGMNAGIQDVPSLTNAIIEVIEKGATSPLMVYSKQRRKEIRKGVNRFTDYLTKLLLLIGKGKLIKPIFNILNNLMKFTPVRRRILKRIAMLS